MRSLQTHVALNEVNFSALKFLIPYFAEFKKLLAISTVCLVGAKLASVGLPLFLKEIVDGLDRANPMNEILVLPLGLLIAYAAVRFSSVLLGELRDTLFGRITERAMRRIGLRVFKHLHRLDLAFHLNRRTGGLSRDIERGTTAISFLMRFMVFNILPTLLEVGLVLVILGWNYHLGYSGLVLVSVVVYIAFSVTTTEWRTGFVRSMNQSESETSTRAVDSLLNYETVKYFTNESYEAARYDEDLAQWERARRKNRLSLFALNGGQALIIATAMGAAMVMAAQDVVDKVMTLGDFVLINAYMMQIFIPLNFLGFVYREMKGALVNIERMFGLLDQAPKVVDAPNAPKLVVSEGGIVFENVGFHYQQERSILSNLSFEVAPKQKAAIVGSSGEGKSTLFKLLFRFYDVNQGRIIIDGQDIKTVTQDSLRNLIGVVPQDTVLFNTSILENVRYGRVSATDDEVRDVIRSARLETFIKQLPDGWHTRVGERGLKLSGGEKQRVAIARALLKAPPILVFDEATSSLDSHSEQGILKAIEAVAKTQTTLVIAHRLSTIVDSDVIFVLDKGQISETGNHQTLLEKQGLYHSLWNAQN